MILRAGSMPSSIAARKRRSRRSTAPRAYHRVADEGMQILGGYSMTPDFPMERHYRDSRIMRIGGGSSEVMRTSIARISGFSKSAMFCGDLIHDHQTRRRVV
jgi:alkylation response protein AidB-like acyl-CoA dehydrogenase